MQDNILLLYNFIPLVLQTLMSGMKKCTCLIGSNVVIDLMMTLTNQLNRFWWLIRSWTFLISNSKVMFKICPGQFSELYNENCIIAYQWLLLFFVLSKMQSKVAIIMPPKYFPTSHAFHQKNSIAHQSLLYSALTIFSAKKEGISNLILYVLRRGFEFPASVTHLLWSLP